MNPTVTYTGQEVAILAGLIACALPALDEDEFEVADLLLDRAIAALPQPLAPDLAERIAHLRVSPLDRFWNKIVTGVTAGQPFSIIDASLLADVRPARAFMWLEQLCGRKAGLRREGEGWVIDA